MVRAVMLMALGGFFAIAASASAGEASISPTVRDEKGVLVHTVQSEYQPGTTKIKVLLPRTLEKTSRYPVLYVLPVEPLDESTWGDGLWEIQKNDVPNKYGVICVQPTFAQTPWYADHPTNPRIRQETYFLKVVVPFIDRTYPTLARKEGRLLLGFSKSGCGAFSLLLRHPDVFGKAAAWDAPLMMERPNKYGMAEIFGTQENFEQYRSAVQLRKQAVKLDGSVRLIHFGYGNFREHHQSAHRLMDELGIAHQYRDGPKREHSWHSGWLPEVVQMLAQDNGSLVLPASCPAFILGADISWVQEQEDEGVRFSDHGKQKDIFAVLKSHGFNWIRLRVFHNPKAGYSKKGYCDLDHTLAMAKRGKAAGMRFLLDFHYSDTWADPGHQVKPATWTDLHGADLEKAVHDHTRDVVAAMKQQGTAPDIVQIGNEISNGFLWPDGNVWKSGKWDVFCGLIKAGIAGAKEADPSVKTMIHLAWGGQNAQSRSFLDKVLAQGVEFDIIGQSYYSKWHGRLDDLKANLTDLAGRYKQDIMVVEYSVPNVRQINDIVHGLPGGKGLGTFIWEPTKWDGPALFDAKGNTKPEIEVYPRMTEDYGKGER